MFKVLFLMLILLAGLVAGPYVAGNQGYVHIVLLNYDIKMSVVTLVILFVLTLAVVHLIEWLVGKVLRLSKGAYTLMSRRRQAKAEKQTLAGLIKMGEGDYVVAEKLMRKSAPYSQQPILNFIKAAESAQQNGDSVAANKYLADATKLAKGSDNLLIEIAHCKIAFAQGEIASAHKMVDNLLVISPKNKEVLKLATNVYLQAGAYEQLEAILPKISASKLYNENEFIELKHRTVDGLLDSHLDAQDSSKLVAWWQKNAKKYRNNIYFQIGLIRRLIDSNDHQSAYPLILANLQKIDDEALLLLLEQVLRLEVADNRKLLKILQKMNNSEPKNAIDRALGYQYARAGEMYKANIAFQKMIDNQHIISQSDYAMIVHVLEKVDDAEGLQVTQDKYLKQISNHKE